MAEIQETALGRMNNGAHFMYAADILARAEEHPLPTTPTDPEPSEPEPNIPETV